MTLVAEVTQELSRVAGLRVQPEWATTIRAAIEKYAASGVRSQGLDAEARRLLISEIARHVTVPETYFFRNLAQLAFCSEHAARVHRLAGQRARIWCAGSATGEEPYSLAILLQRRLGAGVGEAIELSASDLNPDAVEKAQRASYTAWSFRGAPSWCFCFFTPEPGGRLQLSQGDVRALVTFRVESCQTGARNQPSQSLDVITFRNVAIYLEEPAIQALHAEFFRILKPGGLLALGPSDPRPQGTGFEFLGHYDHAPVFARAPHETTGAKPPPLRPAPITFRTRPVGAEPPSERPPARAVEVVQALAAGAPLDATAQRLLGLAHLERNEPSEAVSALRQAVFLDATDVLSRYFYALALYENRQPAKAARQLENVIHDLELCSPDEKLPDGSTTARELLSSANFLGSQWK